MEPSDDIIVVLPVDAVLFVLDVEPVDGLLYPSFDVDARALAEAKVVLFGRSMKDVLLLALLFLVLAIEISLVTTAGSSMRTGSGDLSDSSASSPSSTNFPLRKGSEIRYGHFSEISAE